MKELFKKIELKLYICILSLFFIYILGLRNNTIDMDYWARLLQGNAFLQLGHILKFDPFSYTPTHIWLDHEWGSGVIFSFIQNTFSFDMVLFFRAFIIFLIFFLLYKIIKIRSGIKFNAYSILYFIFALYAIPTISMSGLRCHFLTFLFFTLFLYILELVRKRNKNGLLFILPFVMLIWCNCHGGCVSGLGLLFLYAVGEYLNKKLCAKYVYTLIGCIIIMFINPYGIDYVKFIFMAATMERPFVTEWISPFLHPVPTFMLYFKLFFVLNFVLFIFSVKQIKYDYTKYLILCVCAYLSCRYVKNTPFIVITSIAFLYDDLIFLIEKYLPEGINKISQTRHISVLLVFVLILYNVYSLLKIPNSWNYLSQQPYKVTLFIQNNKLNGKILAPFDYGSYLAYKLYPNNLIYMDGRYEEVYFNSTKKLLDDFFNVQNEGYKVLDDKPEYVIVPSNALVNDYLIQLDDYKLIYKDETDCLYAYKENLKNEYINVPDEEQLKTYIKQQYVMNPSFKYTDDIFINGKKVVFK